MQKIVNIAQSIKENDKFKNHKSEIWCFQKGSGNSCPSASSTHSGKTLLPFSTISLELQFGPFLMNIYIYTGVYFFLVIRINCFLRVRDPSESIK